jgi:RNA polymerase sigma-70 factor (ECF subfamily)
MTAMPRKSAAARTTDADLVTEIARGGISGLGVLFDEHGGDVRRLLSRLGVPSSDLDDLVQQTFLEVPSAARTFRAGAPVKPWLFGLAAVVARRHKRLLARMFARLHRWTLDRAAPNPVTPSYEAEICAMARRAELALHGLSAKKREAFVLVALEGLTGEEAAAAMNVPVATVWTRLHHARRDLRRVLEEAE